MVRIKLPSAHLLGLQEADGKAVAKLKCWIVVLISQNAKGNENGTNRKRSMEFGGKISAQLESLPKIPCKEGNGKAHQSCNLRLVASDFIALSKTNNTLLTMT